MKVDNVPVLGKLKKTINAMVTNLLLLALVSLILGIVILFFPSALEILVAAMLFVTAAIFTSMALHVVSFKRRYLDWMGKK